MLAFDKFLHYTFLFHHIIEWNTSSFNWLDWKQTIAGFPDILASYQFHNHFSLCRCSYFGWFLCWFLLLSLYFLSSTPLSSVIYLYAYEIHSVIYSCSYRWRSLLHFCCCCYSIHSGLNVCCIPNMIDWHMPTFFVWPRFILFCCIYFIFFVVGLVDLSIVICAATIKRNFLYKWNVPSTIGC